MVEKERKEKKKKKKEMNKHPEVVYYHFMQ